MAETGNREVLGRYVSARNIPRAVGGVKGKFAALVASCDP